MTGTGAAGVGAGFGDRPGDNDGAGFGGGDGQAGPGDGQPPIDATKLAAARLWATNRYPYLASAVFASPVVAAPGLGRITIDRWWRIHADPEVVARAGVPELGGELLHLCSHVLRDHAERADQVGLGQPAELHHWVDAADAEINDDFPPELARLDQAVTPESLDCQPARLAEEYYRTGTVRSEHANDCGSGAHGRPLLGEQPPPDDRPDGVGTEQQEILRRRVADEVARADGAAVPAGLRRWADDRRHPTVDWRRELAATVRRSVSTAAGAVDYSYRRPSRRSGSVPGVVLASLRRPVVEVAVVCDTSASMPAEALGAALAEVDAVLRATGTRSVRVLACDDAVHTAARVTRGRDVELIGGGGTDLGTGLDAALALRPTPAAVVVLTDGFTPWPAAAPRAEVVVGLLAAPGGGARPDAPPRWARTVDIPIDGDGRWTGA